MPSWLHVDRSAVKTTGILTVSVSFKSASALLKPGPSNGLCQPHEFCRADGDKCVGNVAENDPRFWVVGGHVTYGHQEANAVCGKWAVKDLDCPPSGCLGFQFTLPSKFVADATPDQPSPPSAQTAILPGEHDTIHPNSTPAGIPYPARGSAAVLLCRFCQRPRKPSRTNVSVA